MKSTSIVIGLLTGCIIAGATNYFDKTGINDVSHYFNTYHLRLMLNFQSYSGTCCLVRLGAHI